MISSIRFHRTQASRRQRHLTVLVVTMYPASFINSLFGIRRQVASVTLNLHPSSQDQLDRAYMWRTLKRCWWDWPMCLTR